MPHHPELHHSGKRNPASPSSLSGQDSEFSHRQAPNEEFKGRDSENRSRGRAHKRRDLLLLGIRELKVVWSVRGLEALLKTAILSSAAAESRYSVRAMSDSALLSALNVNWADVFYLCFIIRPMPQKTLEQHAVLAQLHSDTLMRAVRVQWGMTIDFAGTAGRGRSSSVRLFLLDKIYTIITLLRECSYTM